VEHESLKVHRHDHVARPVELSRHVRTLYLGRRRLVARVEEREAEGGGEERAAVGEIDIRSGAALPSIFWRAWPSWPDVFFGYHDPIRTR
jgi:hypothetical protein